MPVYSLAKKVEGRKEKRDRHMEAFEAGKLPIAEKRNAQTEGLKKKKHNKMPFVADEDLVGEDEVEALQKGFDSDGEQAAASDSSAAVTTDEEDDDDVDESSADEAEIEKQRKAKKQARLMNPEEEMEVELQEPSSWIERMALSATKPLPTDLNPDDDPKREELFMKHALISVKRGIALLEQAKVPWRRPADYFAEMYKADTHMEKIRSHINQNKTRIEQQAKARERKEQMKFGKQVQAEVQQQRAKNKREMLAKVSDWRSKRKKNDNALDDMLGDDDDRGGRGGGGKSTRPGGHKRTRQGPGRQTQGKSRTAHAARGKAMRGRGGAGGGRGGGGRGAGKRPGKGRR